MSDASSRAKALVLLGLIDLREHADLMHPIKAVEALKATVEALVLHTTGNQRPTEHITVVISSETSEE